MIDWDALVGTPATAVFGQPVRVEPVSGATPFLVDGVFDQANVSVFTTEGVEPGHVTALRPVLGVQLGAFPAAPVQDDVLTVLATGERFWVNEVRPDGHGGAMLLLNVAPPGRALLSP